MNPKTVGHAVKSIPLIGEPFWKALRIPRALGIRLISKRKMCGYIKSHTTRKLHLGAGGTGVAGWLNTSIFPTVWPTLHLDAGISFPLPDASFDFVFSEHMIEHLPLTNARTMLKECFRVMKPGGTIRLATPDLAKVILLYNDPSDPRVKDYLAWAVPFGKIETDLPAHVATLNSLFHDHGHQFLYDEEALGALLTTSGFTSIRRFNPGESDIVDLQNLEVHHCTIGKLANEFETLVVQATKV